MFEYPEEHKIVTLDSNVSFRQQSSLGNWDAEECPLAGETAVKYDVKLERLGQQVFITISRFGIDIGGMVLEVSQNMPTLRLDAGGGESLAIKFAHEGLVLIPPQNRD